MGTAKSALGNEGVCWARGAAAHEGQVDVAVDGGGSRVDQARFEKIGQDEPAAKVEGGGERVHGEVALKLGRLPARLVDVG